MMKTFRFLRIALGLAAALAVPVLAQKPLQIWVYSQDDVKYYQSMVEQYNQKTGANLKAEFRAYGYSEMPDKLALAMRSGVHVPDIVQFDEIFFSMYLRGDIPFLDLTDRVAKSPLRTGILPQRMSVFTWQGRVYGIPQSAATVVLWYREDLFRELGISPSDIRTWEDFETVAKRIRTGTRHMLALDWSILQILLRQRGYDFYNRDGVPLADSAVIVDTWKRVARWNQEGVAFMPGQGGIFNPQFFNTSVAENGVLAIVGADWYGLDILQNMDPTRAGKWRAMPLPVWTDKVSRGRRDASYFSGQGLVIFKRSPRTEEAWKFVEWVMSDVDANVERWLQGNALTAYRPAWTDLRHARPEAYFGNQVLANLIMEQAPKGPPLAQSPAHALIANFLREQYFKASLDGQDLTPETAYSEIKAQLAKMGYLGK